MTPPSTLTSAAELTLSDLAALFTRAYEGYEVPVHMDAGAIEFMEETFDLVPSCSRIAWRGEVSAGVAMLGVRGESGWVGGMGVVPEARRSGVGEQLMRALLEQARAAGVRRLGLEVLEHNTGARLLYEKLGFRTFRRLEVYAYDGSPSAGSPSAGPPHTAGMVAEACAPRAARARIAAARRAPEPWQRADATLDRLDVSTPALRAVTTPGGDAVYRITDGRASVLQLAATSETSAGVLIDTIRAREGVKVLRYLNVPDDDLAASALRARGAACSAAQFEMALAL